MATATKTLKNGWKLEWFESRPNTVYVSDDRKGTWSDSAVYGPDGIYRYDFAERVPKTVQEAVKTFHRASRRAHVSSVLKSPMSLDRSSMTERPVRRLAIPIEAARRTERPRYGMSADGYTVRAGAPTSIEIRLEGETRWRRLMIWQFSNAGTLFVRVGGVPYIVSEHELPANVRS